MRLYTFGNYYLSPIQQSLQAAHLVADLFIEYPNELHDVRSSDHKLHDWARNHKTMVCLNGGNNQELNELYAELCADYADQLKLPCAAFYEDEESLGGIMTCCGIVVPAKIYEFSQQVRENGVTSSLFVETDLTPEESGLALLLNKYSLAR